MTFLRARRLRRLRLEREAADKRLQAAMERGDTRAIHAASEALRRATTEVLRAEVR